MFIFFVYHSQYGVAMVSSHYVKGLFLITIHFIINVREQFGTRASSRLFKALALSLNLDERHSFELAST